MPVDTAGDLKEENLSTTENFVIGHKASVKP